MVELVDASVSGGNFKPAAVPSAGDVAATWLQIGLCGFLLANMLKTSRGRYTPPAWRCFCAVCLRPINAMATLKLASLSDQAAVVAGTHAHGAPL